VGHASLDLSRLTYVRWQGCLVGTQLDLSTPLGDVGNDFPQVFHNISGAYLKKLVDQGFMFARKFHTGIQVTETNPVLNAWNLKLVL